MSRYDYYGYFPPSRPIETDDGIKARSQRGQFGKNWWATRWINALEKLLDTGRLSRGRRYARRGQVLSIAEKNGEIQAKVQGSRRTPYKVTLRLRQLSDAEWDKVLGALAEQALFTAQLLAGEMPAEIDSVFQATGGSLFPDRSSESRTPAAGSDFQAPNHPAVDQVFIDDFIDILPINIAIPDIVRINDQDRTLGTTVQAAGGIDPNLADARDTQLFAALLGMVAHGLRIETLTAGGTVFTQVGAEKNVVAVIGHARTIPDYKNRRQALSPAHQFLYL